MSDFIPNFSDPKAWDSFIVQNSGPDGGLLQSWAWGEVQRAYGRRVWRAAALDGQSIAAGWQMIEQPLPLSQRYWYVPRPVKFPISNFQFPNFFEQTTAVGKKENVVFIRVDAGDHAPPEGSGFRKVGGSVQPLEELIVDVTPTAEQLISAMKPKTRYNIRLAEKHGVQVSEIPLDDRGFSFFFPLVLATAARQKIRPHPERYYRAMFSHFSAAGIGHLLVASWQSTPLAAALLVSYNHVLTYLHGGSADEHGEVMAPHLLHWQAILLAKTLGCRKYNLGGVSETNAAWAGITRFKQGFAPASHFTHFGGLWERPVRSEWYWGYRFARRLRNF